MDACIRAAAGVLLISGAGILAADCGRVGPVEGVLVGTFETGGGPVGLLPERLHGIMTLTSTSGTQVSVSIRHGEFTVKLPPGSYRALGRWNDQMCTAPDRVLIRSGRRTVVEVVCKRALLQRIGDESG